MHQCRKDFQPFSNNGTLLPGLIQPLGLIQPVEPASVGLIQPVEPASNWAVTFVFLNEFFNILFELRVQLIHPFPQQGLCSLLNAV